MRIFNKGPEQPEQPTCPPWRKLISTKTLEPVMECVALGTAQNTLGRARVALGNTRNTLGRARNTLGRARVALGTARNTLGNARNTLGRACVALGIAQVNCSEIMFWLFRPDSNLVLIFEGIFLSETLGHQTIRYLFDIKKGLANPLNSPKNQRSKKYFFSWHYLSHSHSIFGR